MQIFMLWSQFEAATLFLALTKPATRCDQRTPGRSPPKRVKFEEPRPLPPPALKTPSSSSSGRFACHDVRVKDGNIAKDSVRVEDAGSPPRPGTSSNPGKGGRNKSSKSRHKGQSSQRPADPLPTRAAKGWLAISGRSEDSGPNLTPSSNAPSSSAAPISNVDADVLRKQLEDQQKFLTQFFEKQQQWAKNMEAEAQKRNLQLGRAQDELEAKENKLIDQSRRLKRSLEGAAAPDPQQPSDSPAMPPLVPRDRTPSDPSSEWTGSGSSSSSLSACLQD